MLSSATGQIAHIEAHEIYSCSIPVKEPLLLDKLEIFFGEKKIGATGLLLATDSVMVAGQLEIEKSFRLYSNMDFFLVQADNQSARIELRIDPTREKALLDPRTTSVLAILSNQ
jgi:hypothetical protein